MKAYFNCFQLFSKKYFRKKNCIDKKMLETKYIKVIL